MVERCWKLMERKTHSCRPDFVIRSRPDVRVASIPRQLQRDHPYLALQDDLWGSDNFFYGDYKSMEVVCSKLASCYDEYTTTLGHASSEPMMMHHIEEHELRLLRFPRCVSVDRSST